MELLQTLLQCGSKAAITIAVRRIMVGLAQVARWSMFKSGLWPGA